MRDNRPEREKIGAAAEVGGAELLANTSMDVAIFDLVAAARRTVTGEGLAERVGFEPTIRFPVYTLSKRAP